MPLTVDNDITPHQGTITTRVRYSECDRMGIAHHSVYPVWLEMARTELLRSTGVSYDQVEKDGLLMVVARLSIHYKSPAPYDMLIRVTATLSEITRAKLIHDYRIECEADQKLIATAQTTLACVDREGRLCKVPDWLVEMKS